jgi:hypothetical protein
MLPPEIPPVKRGNAKDVTAPALSELKVPKGAQNVVSELCYPAWVAQLAGCNPHGNDIAGDTAVATASTGNTGIKRLSMAQIAMTRNLNRFMY